MKMVKKIAKSVAIVLCKVFRKTFLNLNKLTLLVERKIHGFISFI